MLDSNRDKIESLPPPLDRLFTFGEAEFGVRNEKPDYVGQLGLTREHVPGLIEIVRMWEDENSLPDGVAGSAPIHAWRALGQLRAIEAVEPLLAMQNRLDEEGDDWYLDEFAQVFGQIGPAALPALAAYLADDLNGEFPRISAADGLFQIAERYPESRNDVVKALVQQLSRREESVYDLNGFVVAHLAALKATEAAEAIERAFAANVVEDDVCGSWGRVREKLGVAGMGLAPDTPPRPKAPFAERFFDRPPIFFIDNDRNRQHAAEKKAKAKRKQQEKARKRNRKRR